MKPIKLRELILINMFFVAAVLVGVYFITTGARLMDVLVVGAAIGTLFLFNSMVITGMIKVQ